MRIFSILFIGSMYLTAFQFAQAQTFNGYKQCEVSMGSFLNNETYLVDDINTKGEMTLFGRNLFKKEVREKWFEGSEWRPVIINYTSQYELDIKTYFSMNKVKAVIQLIDEKTNIVILEEDAEYDIYDNSSIMRSQKAAVDKAMNKIYWDTCRVIDESQKYEQRFP